MTGRSMPSAKSELLADDDETAFAPVLGDAPTDNDAVGVCDGELLVMPATEGLGY